MALYCYQRCAYHPIGLLTADLVTIVSCYMDCLVACRFLESTLESTKCFCLFRIKTHADVFGLLLKDKLPQLAEHLVFLYVCLFIIAPFTFSLAYFLIVHHILTPSRTLTGMQMTLAAPLPLIA